MNNNNNILADILRIPLPQNGETVRLGNSKFVIKDNILREIGVSSKGQDQTSSTFGYKWSRRETYDDSPAFASRTRDWLNQRYGQAIELEEFFDGHDFPVILDAGCGSGYTASLFFGELLERAHYIGTDVSSAVDTAQLRFKEKYIPGKFLQCDLMKLPLKPNCIDIIYSEGVLHHTDDTRSAILALVPFLKPQGRFMFYVYRRKGPIREFTDDHIREKLQGINSEEAWDALMPLTKLGITLGDLDIEVDIPEEIKLLEIPAGRINIQRLFYWHVFKAFCDPALRVEELNHINFDWFAPANAQRQTIEEVRDWCQEAGLVIERERVDGGWYNHCCS